MLRHNTQIIKNKFSFCFSKVVIYIKTEKSSVPFPFSYRIVSQLSRSISMETISSFATRTILIQAKQCLAILFRPYMEEMKVRQRRIARLRRMYSMCVCVLRRHHSIAVEWTRCVFGRTAIGPYAWKRDRHTTQTVVLLIKWHRISNA